MSSLALVTGATQGIGQAVAEALAQIPGWGVVLVCRDKERGEKVANQISEKTNNPEVWCEQCDLSHWDQVKVLADRLKGKQVSLLINNAAECPLTQQWVTRARKDGCEVALDRQWATNVLGYHYMMRAFLPQPTTHTTQTTVINIASNWAGDLDLSDVNMERRGYDPDTAYRQAKQADRMLSQEWAQTLGTGSKVVSCHPGDPCTTLSTALGYNLSASKDCSRPVGSNILPLVMERHNLQSGAWYEGGRLSQCQFAGQRWSDKRKELFQLCDQFVIMDD